MYIPNAFREDDVTILVDYMQRWSFATLVSTLDGKLWASHLPLVVAVRDDVVTISGHLARANQHWHAFDGREAMAIFTGPHAYISPTHYEQHESVPTWNYIAIHAYGTPRTIMPTDASAELLDGLFEMFETYDPNYRAQWDSLPAKYREGMLRGIVGFEMTITRLDGKRKLSQNRSHIDQETVAHALLQSSDPTIAGTGEEMQRNLTK